MLLEMYYLSFMFKCIKCFIRLPVHILSVNDLWLSWLIEHN